MKNLSFLLLLALAATQVDAQADRFYYPDAFYFVKEVRVEHQKDKAFHFDISVRENPADSFSRPRIYVIQARKGKEDFIGHTFTYARCAAGDWKTYSIDDTADEEAQRIWLYVAVNGNGDFYFDNLHCYLADAGGTLREQALYNASFEDRKPLAGYYRKRSADRLRLCLSTQASDGQQSVQVSVWGQKPSANITRAFAIN